MQEKLTPIQIEKENLCGKSMNINTNAVSNNKDLQMLSPLLENDKSGMKSGKGMDKALSEKVDMNGEIALSSMKKSLE